MESFILLLIGALGVAIVLVWIRLEFAILLPFCSLMWLGEGFHLGGSLPVSPHVICVGLVLAKRLMQRRPQALLEAVLRNRPVLLFWFLFLGAWLYGLACSADSETMKQDATAILYFVALYALVAATPDLNIRRVITGISIVTALAVTKVIYLYWVPVDAQWTNDWQASVSVGSSPLDSRIVLRGADVFFFLAAAFQTSELLTKPRGIKGLLAMLLLVLLGTGIFFSSTRSNWIGFGAMLLVQRVVCSQRKMIAAGSRARVLGIALLAVLIIGLSATREYSPLEKVILRFQETDRSRSIDLRLAESRALIESVGPYFLVGRGLGSQYMDPMAYIERPTGFNHNGYLYLYLKMGTLGLVVYLIILKKGLARLWRVCVRQREERDLTIYVGFLGALVCLCVLSLTVNKNFAVSGAMFSGLALGFCERSKRRLIPALGGEFDRIRFSGAPLPESSGAPAQRGAGRPQ